MYIAEWGINSEEEEGKEKETDDVVEEQEEPVVCVGKRVGNGAPVDNDDAGRRQAPARSSLTTQNSWGSEMQLDSASGELSDAHVSFSSSSFFLRLDSPHCIGIDISASETGQIGPVRLRPSQRPVSCFFAKIVLLL